MTKQITFTAYVDGQVLADECIANPAALAEILHFITQSKDVDMKSFAADVCSETRGVYDAVDVGWLCQLLVDCFAEPPQTEEV